MFKDFDKTIGHKKIDFNLIASLFLEKVASTSKIQYCPNKFDKIIGHEMDDFTFYSKVILFRDIY